MRLVNNLTGQKDLLTQHNKQVIKIFACGPTVYDEIHIGNARPLILADLIIRTLQFQNYQTDYLQNITDIDDKIINKALASNNSEQAVAQKYIAAYLANLKKLNIIMPNHIQLISDLIDQQIKYIGQLIKQGDAYVNGKDVFFRISKYLGSNKPYYGELSRQDLNQVQSDNARNSTINKENPLDFVLWKDTKQGIKFSAPWAGAGRPGWHTECAVVVQNYFHGQSIDLHIGGIDLKFPHHENERIQFIATNQKELARIWIYNGHLTAKTDQNKMSKSLNNVIYLHDFMKQYSGNALRYIFYSTAYSRPLTLNSHIIHEAQQYAEKIDKIDQAIANAAIHQGVAGGEEGLDNIKSDILKALNDNLNAPNALAQTHMLIKIFKKVLSNNNLTASMKKMWNDIMHNLWGFN